MRPVKTNTGCRTVNEVASFYLSGHYRFMDRDRMDYIFSWCLSHDRIDPIIKSKIEKLYETKFNSSNDTGTHQR
jgi:hypothetical protein